MAEALITVHVRPGAKQNQISGYAAGVLRLRVAAPAVEGKANETLIRYLAELFGVRRTDVTIARGAKSREKLIKIEGLEQGDVEASVTRLVPSQVPKTGPTARGPRVQ